MENVEKKPNNSELVPYEESWKLAEGLWKKYEEEIRGNIDKDIEGVKSLESYTDLIDFYLQKVPDEIKERFQGHGVTKTRGFDKFEIEKIAMILNILANKTIKGDWASLVNSGYINAYTKRAPFLILSKKDKNLGEYPEGGHPGDGKGPIRNSIGAQDIGAVVVNSEFYPLYEELKEMFPGINIIKANELTKYLNQ